MNLEEYQKFVGEKLSGPSKNFDEYIKRLTELNEFVNIAMLDTAKDGLCSEVGEIAEVIKKMKFQGKDFNEDLRFHLLREFGDKMFYAMAGLTALGYSAQEVMDENVRKLNARYKDGFTVQESEVRKEGDI